MPASTGVTVARKGKFRGFFQLHNCAGETRLIMKESFIGLWANVVLVISMFLAALIVHLYNLSQ